MKITSLVALFLSMAYLPYSSSLSIRGINAPKSTKFFTRFLTASILSLSITGTLVHPANAIDALDAAFRNSEITYSNNAKNFARMGQGDFSQGSKDISQSPAALKRRAVKGCKTESLRSKSGLSEIECMDKAMNGDIQFMLDIYATVQKEEQ
jgi:hypothetical protein